MSATNNVQKLRQMIAENHNMRGSQEYTSNTSNGGVRSQSHDRVLDKQTFLQQQNYQKNVEYQRYLMSLGQHVQPGQVHMCGNNQNNAANVMARHPDEKQLLGHVQAVRSNF